MEDMGAMMPNPAMMNQQAGMEQKNYQAIFKSEKENYEILNYKFKLEDAEDAFLAKYTNKIWRGLQICDWIDFEFINL